MPGSGQAQGNPYRYLKPPLVLLVGVIGNKLAFTQLQCGWQSARKALKSAAGEGRWGGLYRNTDGQALGFIRQ